VPTESDSFAQSALAPARRYRNPGVAEELAAVLLLVVVSIPLAQVLGVVRVEGLVPDFLLVNLGPDAVPAPLAQELAGKAARSCNQAIDLLAPGEKIAFFFDGGDGLAIGIGLVVCDIRHKESPNR